MAVEDKDLMPRAFKLPEFDDEFKLDIPPTSGLEYLRRVQLEAKQCPDVVVAGLDPRLFNEKQTVHIQDCFGLQPAPSGYTPSIEWQRHQVIYFSQVRQKLARHKARNQNHKEQPSVKLPDRGNVEHWCNLCFGKLNPRGASDGLPPPGSSDSNQSAAAQRTCDSTPGSIGVHASGTIQTDTDASANKGPNMSSAKSNTELTGTPPLLSIIANMDQPTVIRVLEYHINWFEATGFTMEQGCWFYALLVCLEKPLVPEGCALLRMLARHCACLRASLESAEDERLVPLNLLVCLVARYFDQTDLADGS